MLVEDNKKLPSPGNPDGKSKDVSQLRSYPVISKSDSLEDGEIVEGRISSVSSQSRQPPKGQPHLCSSRQVRGSTPVSSTASPGAVAVPKFEPMTNDDLDKAKSLVLDLLGWGVSPEYLVECGLSPGAIYKIFTDLRLRLPSNLERSSPPPSQRDG